MLDMFDAFTGDTTATVEWYSKKDGYYDDDNFWVAEGFKDAVEIQMTPMPYGDRDAGIAGIELKAKTTGERQPAFMKFTGIHLIPINDRIKYLGLTYKIVKRLPHDGSNFNVVIGSTILEDSH